MPVTATAVVTTILLAMHGVALTSGHRLGLADALDYLASRGIPCTASVPALAAAEPVRATLDALRQGGLVTSAEDGREPVWLIGPDQQLPATFYRNSLIHFLLDTALGELAVLRAGEAAGDPAGVFWAEIAWLRDLLKFEFYFRDPEEQRRRCAGSGTGATPVGGAAAVGPGGVDLCLLGSGPWCRTWWSGRSSRPTGSWSTCWRATMWWARQARWTTRR